MDVGLRGAPPRPQPAPAPVSSPQAGPRTAAVLLLCVAALIAVGWVLLAGLAMAPAVSPGEDSFAVRAFAINRFGYGAAALPWYDGGLSALQVAGYETVSNALRRSATTVVAAREATAVAALLAAAALTLAARRLRLSGPATVAVPMLFGLTPAAVLLHRTADPAQLGVLWACIALALAGGEARRTGAAIGSALYLAAAAVSSPLVLVALVPLFTALVVTGDVGRLHGGRRWLVAVVGVLIWQALVVLAVRGDLAGGGSVVPPPLTALDVVLAIAAVAAGIAGLWVRWLRALAVALLAVAVTAAVAADSRGSLLLVALPLAVVVLPAAIDAGVAAWRTRLARSAPVGTGPARAGTAPNLPGPGTGPVGIPVGIHPVGTHPAGTYPADTHPADPAPIDAGTAGTSTPSISTAGTSTAGRNPAGSSHARARVPVAVTATAAVLVAAAWIPSARSLGDDTGTRPEAGDRGALDSARAWVLDNLPSRPRLAVDDALWASLVDAGYPAEQLAAAGGLGPAHVTWPNWTDAAYVVGRDRTLLDADSRPAVRDARRHSVAVAAYGTGEDQVQVRRVLARPDSAAAAARDAAGRVAAGVALSTNPRLATSPAAVTLLRAGRVDARALAVLAAITGEHSLSVADFPVVHGEDPQRPRRLIAVGAIDGRPVLPGATGVTLLDQWLRAQQPPYRPAGTSPSTVDGRPVLLIRYDALGTTGILPP